MPTLSEAVKVIAEKTGSPLWKVQLVGRRLREDQLIPQHGRGLSAAHLEPQHVGALVLGTLVIGQDAAVSQVASVVRRIGNLKGGNLVIEPSSGSKPEGYDTTVTVIASSTPFVGAITRILKHFSDPHTIWRSSVWSVGVTFGTSAAFGWVEVSPKAQLVFAPTYEHAGVRRYAFGRVEPVLSSGIVQEVWIRQGPLYEISLRLTPRAVPGSKTVNPSGADAR